MLGRSPARPPLDQPYMKVKMTFSRLVVTTLLALLCFSSALKSEPVIGWYSAGNLGYNVLETQTISKVGTPFGNQPGGNVKARDGYALIGSAGWGFRNGIRLEVEGAYRRNSLWQATAGALRDAATSGAEKKSSVFFNAMYEYDRPGWEITPYVGVGVGHVWIKWDNVVIHNQTDTEVVRFNDTQRSTAFQGLVGASFLKRVIPGAAVIAEYRILGLDGDRTHQGNVLRSRFGAFPTSATTKDSINHTFVLGIRFQGKPGAN